MGHEKGRNSNGYREDGGCGEGHDIDDLKREIAEYNKELKEAQKDKTKIDAELNIERKNMERLIEEINEQYDLGVTEDNVEEKLQEEVKKIKAELEAGKGILKRIKDGEADSDSDETEEDDEDDCDSGDDGDDDADDSIGIEEFDSGLGDFANDDDDIDEL